jgi:hypothetical protein
MATFSTTKIGIDEQVLFAAFLQNTLVVKSQVLLVIIVASTALGIGEAEGGQEDCCQGSRLAKFVEIHPMERGVPLLSSNEI